MKFDNTYVHLGDAFYAGSDPAAAPNPGLFLWNSDLARQLMVPDELSRDMSALAQFFSGNRMLPGAQPVAMAYAGHQFGHFAPRLGDGRAHLLGEVLDRDQRRWDIQLKGSGRTAFSRGGDGRCALGPAVREFVMSEAMQALGVPTTRCLAVVTTGESVFREGPSPGAVVTRIAPSHVRVGTFQFFAAGADHEAVEALCDYTIARHFPELEEIQGNKYVALLDSVIEKQIRLIVSWMRVGFIHGVMNTDNTALSGHTIDYGPCAMLGAYDPQTVYSSIDGQGRYAFGNQPGIAQWNMARFAECLLPLVDSDGERALQKLAPLIDEFADRYQRAFVAMMAGKLGLETVAQADEALVGTLLDILQRRQLDYTTAFDRLGRSLQEEDIAQQLRADLGDWFDRWQQRLRGQEHTRAEVQQAMQQHNPVVIPRNHHMEAVLHSCQTSGEATAAEEFLQVLRSPYTRLPQTSRYQDPPADGDRHYQTFCGT